MADTKITDVADKAFDYIIAGGGTAGLTLATRLSEDPSVSVLVLEAGRANLNDSMILVPGELGITLGNPNYDWAFSTIKQPYSNNKLSFWSRGKGLGGTSALNFCAWVKPSAADIDAIERLGNPGWGWDNFLKYSKKTETFHLPRNSHTSYPFTKNNRGTTGPIQTMIPSSAHASKDSFIGSLRQLGVKLNEDPYNGDNTGAWATNFTLDPETFSRSYAASAYYQPNKDRPNLTVLTEATVVKVLFADHRAPHENLMATGVEFRFGSDASCAYVAHARNEVILSMGTVKNPQILELSGIGREDVLEPLGVEVKINLSGVGENIQEHVLTYVIFELKDDAAPHTEDLARVPGSAAQSQQDIIPTPMAVQIMSYIPLAVANPKEASSLISKAEKTIEEQKASGYLPAGVAEQYELQLEALKSDAVPDIQIIRLEGRLGSAPARHPEMQHTTMCMILNHPLSRGTIHAVSEDPLEQPEINPQYFKNDLDLEMLVQHHKFMKAVTRAEPLKSMIAGEEDPRAKYTTDEEIREYVKDTASTSWHTVGSCSMLPRDKQGVVDPELKVYGTHNLRVVDLSIIPLHFAAHTQSMAYVIAEKAADIIRGTH